MTDNQTTAALPLRWEKFDDGIPDHSLWTLRAGQFVVGEVYHTDLSAAKWCWQFVGCKDETARYGYPTLEDAQQGLIEAVMANVGNESGVGK